MIFFVDIISQKRYIIYALDGKKQFFKQKAKNKKV